MHHSFVAVDDNQRQEKFVDIHFSRPVDMVYHSLGYGRVAGKLHDQAGPELIVASAMLQAVKFTHIVQQSRGQHRPGRDMHSLLQGQGADLPGNTSHLDAVIYYMPGKVVQFQVMKAFFPGGYFPPGIYGVWNWMESRNH